MKISPKLKTIVYQLSAMLIVMAAIMYSFDTTIGRYAMIVGVAGFAFSTFTTPYPGKSLKGKRLFNIQIFAVLLMAVAAYFMFMGYGYWVVLLFIAAILTLYAGLILPRVYKKEQDEYKK